MIKLKVKCKSYFTVQTEHDQCEWFKEDIDYFVYYPDLGKYYTNNIIGFEIDGEDFKDNFVILKMIKI